MRPVLDVTTVRGLIGSAPIQDVRVGLIGFGFAGRAFHAPLIRATTGLQLVAVATRNCDQVRATLGANVDVLTPDALLARSDIDVVVVATPNDSHRPLTLAALSAGHHVVVDKPFALNASEAREMVRAAEARGKMLSVFHNRRWDGGFLTLRRMLREGRIGRPVEFVSHFDRYRPHVAGRWRDARSPGSGVWMDLGPHLVDHAVQLFGVPDAINLDVAPLRDGAVPDDWFSATMRWEAGPYPGLRARLQSSMLAARSGPHLCVHGTGGSFVVEHLDRQEERLRKNPPPADIRAPDWGRDARAGALWLADGPELRVEPVMLENGAYPAYYAGIRDAVNGTAEGPVELAGAMAVQELLDTGWTSALERREVRIARR